MPINGIIYMLVNRHNGKMYIGKTTKLMSKRIAEHEYLAKTKAKTHLQYAIKKYGIGMFETTILEDISTSSKSKLKSMLNELEILWITKFNSIRYGYNERPGGEGGPTMDYQILVEKLGKIVADERYSSYISKQRQAHTGSNNHFFGKKHSDTTRHLLKTQRIGLSYEEFYGNTVAQDMKEARSIARKGKQLTPEIIEAIRSSQKRGSDRPNFKNVPPEKISELRMQGLKWEEIANHLGVGVVTLRKKRALVAVE